VVGGTGSLGSALASRWAAAGFEVLIGSREAGRAQAAAERIAAETGMPVGGGENPAVVAGADVVVLTVPFAAQQAILEDIRPAIARQLVIDATVPLAPPKVARVQLPSFGCAALRTRQILGENADVCAAFHTVAAHKLAQPQPFRSDVLVFGDQKQQRERVAVLVEAAGLRPVHAGPLQNAVAAESLVPVMIFVNRFYQVEGAGIAITQLDSGPDAGS